MIGVVAASFRSMAVALRRVRLLIVIALAQLVIALPFVLEVGRTLRDAFNHRVDSLGYGTSLDLEAWSDLRAKLAAADPAQLAAAFGAFLLGVFVTGGWLEILSRRERPSGLRVFMAGGAERFFRFLRLAAISLLAIAGARWLLYGEPMQALLRWRNGSEDMSDFSSEASMRSFVGARSLAFAACVALIVLASDLGRASQAARGGRSAIVAAFRGAWLLIRHPLTSVAAASVPFACELLALGAVSWLVDASSAGPPTTGNLVMLLVATQLAVVVRELARAGRLGGLLAVVHREMESAMERRYGKPENVPFVEAAGRATTG